MKKISYLLITIFIISYTACQNADSNKMDETEKEGTAETIITEDNQGVFGSFELEIDGNEINSIKFKPSHTDFTFFKDGSKSFVAIRMRDEKTDDNLLLTIYGDENFVYDPKSEINEFITSQSDGPKANIVFIKGDDPMYVHNSISLVEGTLTIAEFDKGELIGSFAGMGALPKDLVTKENLVPFKGTITIKTPKVMEQGNNDD